MNFRPAVRSATICVFYWAVALLAAHLAGSVPGDTSTALCQIPGLALGLLVLCGLGYTPVVFIGELIPALLLGHLPGALGVELAMAAEATAIFALAAWLVRRKFGPAPVPQDFGQAAALALAAVAVPLATSLATTALIRAGGFPESEGFLRTAMVRWTGGIAGILTVIPVIAVNVAPLLFLEGKERRRPRRRQAAEFVAQAAALTFTVWLVLLAPPLRSQHLYFLCFVPLVWIGLRHGMAGTSLAALVVNFGSLAILRRVGANDAVIANFFLFEIALAAVGLGLGAVVDFRDSAEEALAESRQRLAQVIAGSRLGMWDCDLQAGRVTYDKSWADIVGYRQEELPTHIGWWETQVHPDDRTRVEGLVADHLGGRTPYYEAEFRFRTRAGGWKWIYARGSVIYRDNSGKPLRLAGTQLDVTERKDAEAARLAAERTLLQAQKLESLEVLAGGIAHDFNNLLTVILGNLSLAQMDAAPDSTATTCLQQARKAVVRATELCRQMLAYSGKGQFSATLVDLNALVQDTAQLLEVTINRSCAMEFHLDPKLAQVRVDPTQIRQIVMNLVINASDAIGTKGGLIRVSTGMKRADAAFLAESFHAAHLAEGDYVTLEVLDNGCGMTPEVRSRVFEPFFTTKFTGRGLGLAAVLGIVRSYGGALTVASELGKGSTFTLLLPAQAGKGEEETRSIPVAARADLARDRGTILVVDDEETVRVVAARLLESQGYTTILAEDGLEAVNILATRGKEISAALLDLTMPRMNGAQTLHEFRRLRPGFPVVVMSGYSEWESAGRLPGAEPSALIPKPFDREVLIARIREAVGNHSA